MGKPPAEFPGVETRGKSLRIYFRYRRKLCRERLNLAATPANKKHAFRLRQRICEEIRVGIFDYAAYFPDSPHAPKSSKPTFSDLADDWMADNSELALATRKGYQKIINKLYLPEWADKPIDQITFRMIQNVLQSHPWQSMKTRNNALTPLRGVFDLAMQEGNITRNPVLRVKRVKSQKPPPDPLELEEVNAILDWLNTHRDQQYRNYFEFAFFAGARTSELIALDWPCIDLRQGYARIDKARVMSEVKPTKTYSVRDIELNNRAKAALARQKKHTYLASAQVFIDPITKRPYVGDKPPRLVWDAALKALGVRHRTAYQTRHTFATLNLMAGANPMWVARQLGHTTMAMVLEHYGRWIDKADKSSERDKLDRVLSGNTFGNTHGNEG